MGLSVLYNGKDPTIQPHIDEYLRFGIKTVDYEVITDPKIIKELGYPYYWNKT